MKNIDQFLTGLAELTSRHGIAIGGCGCCGSPALFEAAHPEGTYVLVGDDEEKLTFVPTNGGRTPYRPADR